jgi:hypothetical protein
VNFELTGEQRGLVESTHSVLVGRAPRSTTPRLVDSAEDFDVELVEAFSGTQV